MLWGWKEKKDFFLTELTAGLLLQNGVDRVVAAALRHSPGEYEVWTR